MFFEMQKYLFSESLFNRGKKQMLKIFLLWANQTLQKINSFFFRELNSLVLLLICDSYMSWYTRFVPMVWLHQRFYIGFNIFG